MKIAVVGTGYVGLSMSILLSQYNDVTAVDIIPEKVDMINNRKSPIVDKEIEEYLAKDNLRLHATTDASAAYADAEFVIVSTPTNYDEKLNYFDTSSVASVVAQVRKENPDAFIVIKSTIPVGYTQELRDEYNTDHIMFSPEFLREGHALYDNLYPSRIIVGYDIDSADAKERAEMFASLLKQGAIKEDVKTLFMNSTEAESVKLFANTYLALRVSFQFQSDILQCEVSLPHCLETTALGAGYFAGLACGFWKSFEEIKETHSIERVYNPKMSAEEAGELYDGWLMAVQAARAFKPKKKR